MDEMKIGSNFTKDIISKIICNALAKKLNIHPLVSFGAPIAIESDDENFYAHVDLNVAIGKDDVSKLLKNVL